jgi:hypothetical protein
MLTLLSRRLSAVLVLVTLLGGAIVPLFGDLHAEADTACAEDAWGGTPHHQTTQFESIRPPVSGEHCAVCHLQRAMGSAADDAKRYVPGAVAAPRVARAVARTTRDAARHEVPSRAPPAFFL